MRKILGTILLGLALVSCRSGGADETQSERQPLEVASASPSSSVVTATPGSAECPGKAQGRCGSEESGSCGDGVGGEVQHPASSTRTDPVTGRTVEVVGSKLAGLTAVTVAELSAHPEKYRGQTVHLNGEVVGMCHHRRGWFAIRDAADGGAGFVRVITRPAFLVPQGAIGKTAATEGVVDLIDVPAPMAAHLANDHQIGEGHATQSVIVRASGAEFL